VTSWPAGNTLSLLTAPVNRSTLFDSQFLFSFCQSVDGCQTPGMWSVKLEPIDGWTVHFIVLLSPVTVHPVHPEIVPEILLVTDSNSMTLIYIPFHGEIVED